MKEAHLKFQLNKIVTYNKNTCHKYLDLIIIGLYLPRTLQQMLRMAVFTTRDKNEVFSQLLSVIAFICLPPLASQVNPKPQVEFVA